MGRSGWVVRGQKRAALGVVPQTNSSVTWWERSSWAKKRPEWGRLAEAALNASDRSALSDHAFPKLNGLAIDKRFRLNESLPLTMS